MKFRHTVYPEPLCFTSAGKARFKDHWYETTDKKMIAALKKFEDVVVVMEPSSQTEED